MFFFDGSYSQIFLFENTYGNCIPDFQVDLSDTSLTMLEKKGAVYDQKIAEKIQKFYDFIEPLDIYFKKNSDNEYASLFYYLRYEMNANEEFDQNFFINASKQPYHYDGIRVYVDFLQMVNDFYDDFNNNYFEYYLSTQHLENISCCFLFTFRQVSKFFSRVLNCKFFFCIFDLAIQAYLDKLDELEFRYTKDDSGNIVIADEDVSYNVTVISEYLNLRTTFMLELSNFYTKLYQLFDPIITFLVRLKVIIKIISIVNIIVNSHAEDTETIMEHISSILDLLRGAEPNSPAVFKTKYIFYIDKYQYEILPQIVKIKLEVENANKLTMSEKEKFKKYLILFSLHAIGMVIHCEELYSLIINYLNQYKESKIEYFGDKSEDEINEFQVKAYNPSEPDKLNPCYIIDLDNPPTTEELQELYDEMNNTTT